MKCLNILLKPLFAVCLLRSQFAASRTTILTDSLPMVVSGAVVVLLGILLLVSASSPLSNAQKAGGIATSGPFRYIRHPIYTGVYVFSIGLGLLFYTWIWFAVLGVFAPLWYLVSKGEERQMIEEHGEEYLHYMSKTGMFVPRV